MKRFRIVIFNENYSGSNYDDYIYLDPKNDTFENTLVILQEDNYENILKAWDILYPMYVGMTYCVRDMEREGKPYISDSKGTERKHSTLLIGGIFDPYDIDSLCDYQPDTFEFDTSNFES